MRNMTYQVGVANIGAAFINFAVEFVSESEININYNVHDIKFL